MRHSAIYFVEQITSELSADSFELIFCTDFLNVAEFKGLLPNRFRQKPLVVYFHENQFNYPTQVNDPRDLNYAFTNFTSCLAADAVWFNSQYHRTSFMNELSQACQSWPDFPPTQAIDSIPSKSSVQHPGLNLENSTRENTPPTDQSPLRILWAARWEHDKNPELLLEGLRHLQNLQVPFQLDVLGESFRQTPQAFSTIKTEFSEHINRWGFQSAADYQLALHSNDVFVSTANHEFFGISAAEAIVAGNIPMLPNRLAYPELINLLECPNREQCFLYDGTPRHLADRLNDLWRCRLADPLESARKSLQAELSARFKWETQAPLMDDEIERISASDSLIG